MIGKRHIFRMQVAVSISDQVAAEADVMARRLGTTRSALYEQALEAYIAGYSTGVSGTVNTPVEEVDAETRMWLKAGARTVLKHTEW